MKTTRKLKKMLVFRAFGVVLIFGLLFIGCGEYKPDIGKWIDEQLEKARETEEVPTIEIMGIGTYSGSFTVNYVEMLTSTNIKHISGTMSANGTVSLQSQPPKGALIVSIQAGADTNPHIYIGRLVESYVILLKLNLDALGNLELCPADSGGIIPIGTYAEFQLIRADAGALSGNYIQEADLDLMGNAEGLNVPDWEPIGSNMIGFTGFTGTFDGDGKHIDRLYINDGTRDNVGLFGYSDNATITAVHIKSGSVTGKSCVGGILGQGTGNISFSSNNAQINGATTIGGIAGLFRYSSNKLFACYNTGDIESSGNAIGGLVGVFVGGDITACYNTGTVHTNSDLSGGLVGIASAPTKMTACYNTGTVWSDTTNTLVAGIAGVLGNGEMLACYNAGAVICPEPSIGLVYAGDYTQTACYWKIGSSTYGLSIYEVIEIPGFADFPTPDTTASSEWGTGQGTGSGTYWKEGTTNGSMLPKLWYEN